MFGPWVGDFCRRGDRSCSPRWSDNFSWGFWGFLLPLVCQQHLLWSFIVKWCDFGRWGDFGRLRYSLGIKQHISYNLYTIQSLLSDLRLRCLPNAYAQEIVFRPRGRFPKGRVKTGQKVLFRAKTGQYLGPRQNVHIEMIGRGTCWQPVTWCCNVKKTNIS